MALHLWLLLATLPAVGSQEPCTALTTVISGDSTVVTIDCPEYLIMVTCAQEATKGCSSQKLPKVQSSTLTTASSTSFSGSVSSSSTSSSTSSSISTSSSTSTFSSSSASITSSSTSSSTSSTTTSTCTDCTSTSSTTSSTTSTSSLVGNLLWINGFLTFQAQDCTAVQVQQACHQTFLRLLRAEDLRVTATTETADETTWRVAFSVAEATAGAADTARATLQALGERIAGSRAAAFAAELENQLMDAGATPGGDFRVIELSLMEVLNQPEESNNSWWVLILVLVLLALALLTLVCLRRNCQGDAFSSQPKMASKALWELEEERWELAEKVLDTEPPAGSIPQQWRAQWNAAADETAETRFYDLSFGAGGRLEGIGEGRNGSFKVTGAFDVKDGSVRWREVPRGKFSGGDVVECYGQWDGMRIDGFFTAFDVSTLPQQIGQGHFALAGRAAKDAAPNDATGGRQVSPEGSAEGSGSKSSEDADMV